MSASKAKGTAWESAIVAYLIGEGWVHAERRTLSGTRDRGDIAGLPGVVIEAKNEARVALAEYITEAEAERQHANASVGVAWVHRRGRTSPADGYVLMTGATFVGLLHLAGW